MVSLIKENRVMRMKNEFVFDVRVRRKGDKRLVDEWNFIDSVDENLELIKQKYG